MLVYPKIAHEVLLIRAIFILEVYAYLVVAVTLKIWSSHAGLSETTVMSASVFFSSVVVLFRFTLKWRVP